MKGQNHRMNHGELSLTMRGFFVPHEGAKMPGTELRPMLSWRAI